MDRKLAVQKILEKINGRTYLEIGVEDGYIFGQINAENKIGVDPMPAQEKVARILNENTKYFEMASDDFFKNEAEKIFSKSGIDAALIDGLHEYRQALRDVKNCLRYLNANGVIVMHDCNPATEEMQIVPRMQAVWTGDVWKAVAHMRQSMNDINIFVLNCDYGLGIITKGKPENMLDCSAEELENLSYEDLKNNREKLLNLKDAGYLQDFLEKLNG